jgi:hypothetical protein
MPLAFTVLPDPPYQRLIDVGGRGEQHGFEYGWIHDSQGLLTTERAGIGSRSCGPGHARR